MAFYTLGIENAWTLVGWFKSARDTHDECFVDFAPETGNADRITVSKLGTETNNPLEVKLYDSAGTLFKHYKFESVVDADGIWRYIALRWDGTTLTVNVEGDNLTPDTVLVDVGGTMGTTERCPVIANNFEHTMPYSGLGYYVALWSEDIGALASTALFSNPTAWLRDPIGGYTNTATLVHWWRLGEPAHNEFEGTTWIIDAVIFNGIDLSTNAANMSDADKVAEQPTTPTVVFIAGSLALDLSMSGSLYGRKLVPASIWFGSSEWLANNTTQPYGLGNTWSIAFAFNRNDALLNSNNGGWFGCGASTANNNYRIEIGANPGGVAHVYVYDSAGTIKKNWTWAYCNDGGRGDKWYMGLVTWDGTDLRLYMNGGELTAPTKITDAAVTVTDVNRVSSIAATTRLLSAGVPMLYMGPAIWNTTLTAAEAKSVTKLYAYRDLRFAFENYASPSSLVHYGRPGLAPNASESGPSWYADNIDAAGIDFTLNATSVDSSNIVTEPMDYPYLPSERAHALEFNGTNEWIESTTDQNHLSGSTNGFSIKFAVYSTRGSADETIFQIITAAGTLLNRVDIRKLGTVANDPLQILLWNSSGIAYKDYRWDSALPLNTWKTYTMVYTIATDSLVLYDSAGSVVTPSSTPTDSTSGALSNTTRCLVVGAAQGGSAPFQGRLREIALFNDALTSGNLSFVTPKNVDLHSFEDLTNWPNDDTASGIRTLTRWLLLGIPGSSHYGHTTNNTAVLYDYPGRYFSASNDIAWTVNNMDSSNIVSVLP